MRRVFPAARSAMWRRRWTTARRVPRISSSKSSIRGSATAGVRRSVPLRRRAGARPPVAAAPRPADHRDPGRGWATARRRSRRSLRRAPHRPMTPSDEVALDPARARAWSPPLPGPLGLAASQTVVAPGGTGARESDADTMHRLATTRSFAALVDGRGIHARHLYTVSNWSRRML